MRDAVIQEDLNHILSHTQGLWEELRGGRVFITGGTGFFGYWLLESFVAANERLKLGASAVVLSRNPDTFARKCPYLAEDPAIEWVAGDIRSFEFPKGDFSHVIHAAAEVSAVPDENAALAMFDTIVEGTRRTLDFAIARGVKKFLLTSSGAVYGKQPPEITHIPEDYNGAPNPLDPRSAYGEGKRAAELLCALYSKIHGIQTKIARCFAFVGPRLPLDAHFAVGNFIGDGLRGRPIVINGDGTPSRSYLYAGDLAIWLWTILCKGKTCRPYNVGAEEIVSILDLAKRVSSSLGGAVEIQVAGKPIPGQPAATYVPSVRRAKDELGLNVLVPLEEAVSRTILWHQGLNARS